MKLPLQQFYTNWLTVLILTVSAILPSAYAGNATVDIDYAKQGACNSSILIRVGDYCDYVVTITVELSGASTSTDLTVEIIMPDNDTVVMQMSKPSVTYVGGNFQNSQSLYAPSITMTSQLNNSQYDDAIIDFGTVVNNGLTAANSTNQSSISIAFRSVVISSPGYQTNGSQYWVTVGVEYNNSTTIWIGQALFIFSNATSGGTGPFVFGTATNSSLNIPQGSPFALAIPVTYNYTYATNVAVTITNNNPSQLGLCSAYIQDATNGFAHLPTLGYEISQSFTSSLVSNQITITLGQVVNTQSYNSPSASILYVVVYGRVFKTDGLSSYTAGTMTAVVTSGSTPVQQIYTVYATASLASTALNGSLPTFSVAQQTGPVGAYQAVTMSITMTVPSGFSAPVVFDLNGGSNTSSPVLKSCAIIIQSAGENVGSASPQCIDPNFARRSYSSSDNSTNYDLLTYDYGVISNLGPRSTIYSSGVNTIVFNAVFQLLNTTQSVVWPAVSMTLGNNTIWLANAAVNVTTINYNATNLTRPSFQLSYENNATANQSVTTLGLTRLFYYDIFTKASGVYTPMTVRITTNTTALGSNMPAASICVVKIIDVGGNVPCLIPAFYNQAQSPFITYSSNYNQRKNDTAYVQIGPLCNYQSSQSDDSLGRIRIGVYVKAEQALGDGQSTYVNLDVYYAPTSLWIGQILFTGNQLVTPAAVVGAPLFFSLNSTQTFNRNTITVITYGLKIPPNSQGTYTSLTSAITNDANNDASVCRVDIAPNRGSNVPCANDVSSVFSYNSNGVSSSGVTNLGMICSIASNGSVVNSTLSLDADTLIVQVFLLGTSQTGSTFDLTLSNLVPSGRSPLPLIASSFTAGSTGTLGNITSINPLNATNYQPSNDTNNVTIAYLGQDLLIRTAFVLATNLTDQACYPLVFLFSLSAGAINSAYFTNAFLVSSGDNLMCMKSKATPVLGSGDSTLYNASMYLDLGSVCYYPIDPTNVTASTLIIQSHVRVPVSTTVAVNNQITVNIVGSINNNQSNVSTTIPFTVQSQTAFTGFTLFSNDTTGASVAASNSTLQSVIRQSVTYNYKIYLPTFSQGRLQISIASVANASSVTVNIVSATILSAGINVGSFMAEYALGNKYVWTYSSSVPGAFYKDTAYLDLGVVTNTGTSTYLGTFSNTTDNYIYVQATGYLTDSPAAETNTGFTVVCQATYGGINVSAAFLNVVSRNGSEEPIMYVNHTDLTTGSYGVGSIYSGQVDFGHENSSNAECINAQLIVYLPAWITFVSYNSTIASSNSTTDSASYVIFNLGTIYFNEVGSVVFTLSIGASSDMSLVYRRYNSAKITIPYEFLCMKRPRVNVQYYPTTKVFAYNDIISLPVSMTSAPNYPSLLDTLDACQFTSSVRESDASLVRTTGWQTGYRSNQWMLSGGTYLQINFGNLTLISGIGVTVPSSFAPIATLQLGYSWDGSSFTMDLTTFSLNGSSAYTIPLAKPLQIRYLRVYVLDVVQPTDLRNRTTGFTLNITGIANSTDVTLSSICPVASSALLPRTILVAPPTQIGLSYYGDVYVCDETTTRTSILCHVLLNGVTTASATWMALNTSVAHIELFVFDPSEQLQFLYGYAQDGVSVIRSDDRGLTWSVTDANEYANVTAQCNANVKVCRQSDPYSLMLGASTATTLQSGAVPWTAKINGLWTQSSGGVLAFDWFGY